MDYFPKFQAQEIDAARPGSILILGFLLKEGNCEYKTEECTPKK
jgi:hypothetical protein